MLFTFQHFSTQLNTFPHIRAARGRSAKCSISESSLKEAFEGESLSFFCSSSEKWGAQVQAPTLRMQCSKTTLLGELTTILVPSNTFGPFNFFWALQLIFKRVLDRALRYPQLSFIKTPVEAFDTQMHTQSNASYVLFFFFRSLVIAIGNWGRCYWWYVFVRTCASRSTQHAEIIQHMLENLAMIALHKLCNTCSKKRHNMKGENGRGVCVETASPCGQTLLSRAESADPKSICSQPW